MKLRAASIITLLLLFTLATAFAIETPRIVPRVQEVPKPEREVFASVRHYSTDSSHGHCNLVRADEQSNRTVATQTALDDLTWRDWASCETGPVQMIYKLE